MGLIHVAVFGAVISLSMGHHKLDVQSRNQDTINEIQKSIFTPEYNVNVRPYDPRNENGTTQVSVQFKSLRVIAADEALGKITVQAYFRQRWIDPRLAYGKNFNISYFPLRESKGVLWTPDLFLVNNIESLGGKHYGPTRYTGISPDGSVFDSKRLTKTFFCPELFNRETKEIVCQSQLLSYGYYADELQISFDSTNAFLNNERDVLSLEKFNFEGASTSACPQTTTDFSHSYSCVNVLLKLTRK